MKLRALLPLVAALGAGCAVEVAAPAVDDAGRAVVAQVEDEVVDDAEAQADATHDAAIAEVLEAAAAAFRDADPEALRPLLHDPGSRFGQRWLERASNLAGVPLSRYELVLDESLPDLVTSRVAARYDGDVQVRYVVEEHALTGFDDNGPATEDLFLTVVDGGDGWRIASDTDAQSLGLISVDHLWDHGPVVTTGAGSVVALHHPDTAGLDEVLTEAAAALELVRQRWPLAWPEKVPVLVPRDEEELGELLHVTFDLSNFIAFATATPDGELGEYELTGSRILLNTERFLSRTSATRQRILVHELTHIATRPYGGPYVPAWLDEGVAQALGEQRATTGLAELDALIARGARLDLPTDGQFTTGGRDRIFLSYQLGYSFLDFLVDTYGADRVAGFYAEVGSRSTEPGTEAWHVDQAALATFDDDLARLVEDWRASLRY